MFRVIAIIVYFFREMVFDSKEEYNIKSKHFSLKKVSLFVLVCVMAFANGVFLYRIYALAVENDLHKKEIIELKRKNTSELPSDSEKKVTINQPDKPGRSR